MIPLEQSCIQRMIEKKKKCFAEVELGAYLRFLRRQGLTAEANKTVLKYCSKGKYSAKSMELERAKCTVEPVKENK